MAQEASGKQATIEFDFGRSHHGLLWDMMNSGSMMMRGVERLRSARDHEEGARLRALVDDQKQHMASAARLRAQMILIQAHQSTPHKYAWARRSSTAFPAVAISAQRDTAA